MIEEYKNKFIFFYKNKVIFTINKKYLNIKNITLYKCHTAGKIIYLFK